MFVHTYGIEDQAYLDMRLILFKGEVFEGVGRGQSIGGLQVRVVEIAVLEETKSRDVDRPNSYYLGKDLVVR